MTKLTATVERVESDLVNTKFGSKTAFKIFTTDGRKLSAGFRQPQVAAGKTYEFETKGDQYNTVIGYIESSAGAPAPQAQAGSPAQGINLGRDRAIIRQNALTNAVSVFNTMDGQPTLSDDAEIAETATLICKLAAHFEAYTSGDVDLAAAEEMLDE